ncbi:MAG: hypothetical protein BGO21_30930 [Dyadobacter sp. 50-39]|nr:MAG: hypothetical protein BGO21_30930 [Dyadobacter sp. 50-39]
MYAVHKSVFLIAITFHFNLAIIDRVLKRAPERGFTTFEAFSSCLPPHLLDRVNTASYFGKGPFHDSRVGLMKRDILCPVLGYSIYVPHWCDSHIPPFLPCPPHTMKCIQRPTVILHFRCSQVKRQHHLVFRDRQVKWLLDCLRFYTKLTKYVYHLIGISRISAKPVPFSEKYQIDLSLGLFEG